MSSGGKNDRICYIREITLSMLGLAVANNLGRQENCLTHGAAIGLILTRNRVRRTMVW